MRRATMLAALLAALGLFGNAPAFGQAAAEQASPRTVAIADHVTEASQRFGIPESWIYAVMRTESAGRIGAVSSAGAMGLMQLMPGTWARQRAQVRAWQRPLRSARQHHGGRILFARNV